MPSHLDEALMDAYRQTEYRVDAEAPFTLRIDEPSTELLNLYADRNVRSAAFLTACNPQSRLLDERENELWMKRLAEDVARLGCKALSGFGADPAGDWPGEPSLLVLGIALDEARRLGQKYEQNALVWCGEDAVPRLELLG